MTSLAAYVLAQLLARLTGRHLAPVLPHPTVPMCPWCGADVRYAGRILDHPALTRAGGRGETWLCECGTYQRWEMHGAGPLPVLLASSRARPIPPRGHTAHRHTVR